ESGCDFHHAERAKMKCEKPLGKRRPQRRAGRRAHGDQGKKASAIGAIINLIRIRPELGNGGQAENTHPHKKYEPEMRNPYTTAEEKELDASDEEKYHCHQKLLPRKPRRRPAH